MPDVRNRIIDILNFYMDNPDWDLMSKELVRVAEEECEKAYGKGWNDATEELKNA